MFEHDGRKTYKQRKSGQKRQQRFDMILPRALYSMNISRAWRETVVTKNLFWKPWLSGNFDPFVHNATLDAIAQNEQWHLNFHCLPIQMI